MSTGNDSPASPDDTGSPSSPGSPEVDPRTGREPDDPQNSNDDLAGDMGVSSEREGHAGPGQHGTDGVRYTGPTEPPADAPPEQSAGGEEPHPDSPIPPVSGYGSRDPRSEDHPFKPSQ